MGTKEISSYFDEGEFDFFISLRNLQTHVYVPIVSWARHHSFQTGTGRIETPVSEKFILEIEKDATTNKRNRFKHQGLEFIRAKNKVCFGILMTQFWKKMNVVSHLILQIFLDKYGQELDVCEYYLKELFESNTASMVAALKQANPNFSFEMPKDRERFYHVLLMLGGQPQFCDIDTEQILFDTSNYKISK